METYAGASHSNDLRYATIMVDFYRFRGLHLPLCIIEYHDVFLAAIPALQDAYLNSLVAVDLGDFVPYGGWAISSDRTLHSDVETRSADGENAQGKKIYEPDQCKSPDDIMNITRSMC